MDQSSINLESVSPEYSLQSPEYSLQIRLSLLTTDDIETIIGQKIDPDGKKYFHIQKEEQSEWVEFEAVSKKSILKYYSDIAAKNAIDPKTPRIDAMYDRLFKTVENVPQQELLKILSKYQSPRGLQLPASNKKHIREMLEQLKSEYVYDDRDYENKRIELRQLAIVEKILELRKKQIENLKMIEKDWNEKSDNKLPLTVTNEFDLEIPDPLGYINSNIISPNCDLSLMPIQEGCECFPVCSPSTCSCILRNEIIPPYINGKLNDKFFIKNNSDTPIYECSYNCVCWTTTCSNRLIQNGSGVEFELFRTFNGCGWGVRTGMDIEKGTFVIGYNGEITTATESQKPTSLYLFVLGKKKGTSFFLDAEKNGNMSRFMNHSCEPNLIVMSVFTKFSVSSKLREFAFFANCNIEADEELCIDYGKEYKLDPCKCNRKNCKSSKTKQTRGETSWATKTKTNRLE